MKNKHHKYYKDLLIWKLMSKSIDSIAKAGEYIKTSFLRGWDDNAEFYLKRGQDVQKSDMALERSVCRENIYNPFYNAGEFLVSLRYFPRMMKYLFSKKRVDFEEVSIEESPPNSFPARDEPPKTD